MTQSQETHTGTQRNLLEHLYMEHPGTPRNIQDIHEPPQKCSGMFRNIQEQSSRIQNLKQQINVNLTLKMQVSLNKPDLEVERDDQQTHPLLKHSVICEDVPWMVDLVAVTNCQPSLLDAENESGKFWMCNLL